MGEPWPWVEVGPGLYRGKWLEMTHDCARLSPHGKRGNAGVKAATFKRTHHPSLQPSATLKGNG